MPTPRRNTRDSVTSPNSGFYATVACAVLIFILLIVIFNLAFCSGSPSTEETQTSTQTSESSQTSESTKTQTAPTGTKTEGSVDGINYILLDEGRTTGSGEGKVTFSAVGDNLMNENLLELANKWGGGDNYNFSPFYTEISNYINANIDISFINQETTLGVFEGHDWAGYPSYNTPPSMADAVANAGWRVVNTNSNHLYDTWSESIENAQKLWNAKSSLLAIGSYTSQADRNKIRVVECNGIKIAFLSYCYGQNYYEQSDLPNDYYSVVWDEDAMKSDVAKAKKVADAVVVYIHDGEEYSNEPSASQTEEAKACADAGVTATIFSHSHVIEPVDWILGSSGNYMFCAYGLGDFIAGYTSWPDTIMSGMVTLDFIRGEDGTVYADNACWHPLIEHMQGDADEVRFVKNYSEEDANNNELLKDMSNINSVSSEWSTPREWIVAKTNEVLGSNITIDW